MSGFGGMDWLGMVMDTKKKGTCFLHTCLFRKMSSFQLSHFSLFLLLRSLVCDRYDLWVRY